MFAGTKRSIELLPFHAAAVPTVSFIAWPYDDDHQRMDDLALIDRKLVHDLSEIGRAVTRNRSQTLTR